MTSHTSKSSTLGSDLLIVSMRVVDIQNALTLELMDERVIYGGRADGSADMVELVNANFVADQPTIFGAPSPGYIARELEWYLSQSLNVNDIPGGAPAIWQQVATLDGFINSNYGHLIYSAENHFQYTACLRTLIRDSKFCSRQASMIYTRPSIQYDAFKQGMNDFICTDAVHVFLRRGQNLRPKLYYVVYMRSNDAVFGYKNDLAWHEFVLAQLVSDLKESNRIDLSNLEAQPIQWNAASLHVYRRHFDLIAKSEDS